MKRSSVTFFVLFYAIVLLSSSFGQAQTQKNTWFKMYGGNSGGSFHSIDQTDDGNYMLAGNYVFGPTWPNYTEPSGKNTWLIKTDSSGETTIDNKLENRYWENPELFHTNDGNYIMVGPNSSPKFYVMRINSLGNPSEYKIFDGYYIGVAQSSNGDFAVLTLPEGSTDSVYIYKFNASDLQSPMWTRLVTIHDELAAGIIATNDGGFAVAGDYFSYWTGDQYTYSSHAWFVKLDSQGNIQLNYLFENSTSLGSFIGTEDGGYLFTEGTNIKKADSNMNIQWTKSLKLESEPTSTYITSIISTNDGCYALAIRYFAATTEKSVVGLVKINNSGDMQWNKWYNATWIHEVIQTKDGGYALVGEKALGWYDVSIGWNAGNYGVFIKTDSDGNAQGEIALPAPTASPTPSLGTPTVAPTNVTFLPSPSTSTSPSSLVGQLFENPITMGVIVLLIICTILGLAVLLAKRLRKVS